jgi:hypothetical protein
VKKLSALALALVSLLWLTGATWLPLFVPAVVTYQGPGDLSLAFPVLGYWGWSCVTKAYSGAAIDLVDTATGTTTGTRLMCSSGSLVALVSGSACTFVTGNACSSLATTCASSCSVVTKYEQTGTLNCNSGAAVCNQTQSTNSLRPTYTASGGAGGKACEAYTSTQLLIVPTGFNTQAQPFSMDTIDSRTGGTSSLSTIFTAAGSLTGVYHSSTAGNAALYAGSISANVVATDNAFHAIQSVFNGASSILAVDGSNSGSGTTVSPGAGVISTNDLQTGNGGGGSFTGVNCEEILFGGSLTAANNVTLNTNMHGRFGF